MKGDFRLVPVVLRANDAEELARMVVAERIRKDQIAAVAHYTAVYIPRKDGTGYVRYTAFVEFMVEEK